MNQLIEMRWLDRNDWMSKPADLVLQYRTRVNVLEVGLHEPIWSDWDDVPTVYQNETGGKRWHT